MSPDLIFTIASTSVLPAWLLLVFAPRAAATKWAVHSAAFPLVLSVLYAALVLATFGDGEGDFGSLRGVMQLFENEWAVLLGWVHYLAFDLFIGAWETRDAARIGVPHYLVVPCLFFTFMLGPVGLLLYFVIRAARTRRLLYDPLAT